VVIVAGRMVPLDLWKSGNVFMLNS
jgi:hypothetical protein